MNTAPEPTKPAFEAIVVESWAQLLDELYRDAWNADIHRFRSPNVFRGVNESGSGLVTGLSRLGSGTQRVQQLERHLLRNFQKYAVSEAHLQESCWRWLPFAQHYGLPTRLLDWTFSPLVAIHFATDNPERYDRDAAVWCFNHIASNRLLPEKLKKMLAEEGADVFTAGMLETITPSLDDFDHLSSEPYVLFLEPPSFDRRIANQFALFSILSDAALELSAWLESRPGLVRQLIIPAQSKPEIRDKLDQAGITERLIYPGADGIARWLSRYYRPAKNRSSDVQRK